MSVMLLIEHHLEFLSLKGGCTGSSESTLVKMPHCLKSHVVAYVFFQLTTNDQQGAQWLSGRVLDSRLRGHGVEPHRRRCVVSLSKTHLSLLSTGSTQEDPSRHN